MDWLYSKTGTGPVKRVASPSRVGKLRGAGFALRGRCDKACQGAAIETAELSRNGRGRILTVAAGPWRLTGGMPMNSDFLPGRTSHASETQDHRRVPRSLERRQASRARETAKDDQGRGPE